LREGEKTNPKKERHGSGGLKNSCPTGGKKQDRDSCEKKNRKIEERATWEKDAETIKKKHEVEVQERRRGITRRGKSAGKRRRVPSTGKLAGRKKEE